MKTASGGLRPLRLHVGEFTGLARHVERDGTAADRAIFDRRVIPLGRVDCRREILSTPRAADLRLDDQAHSFNLSRGASLHKSSRL